MLLRSLLVRKVPYLINEKGEAQVDVRVIRFTFLCYCETQAYTQN